MNEVILRFHIFNENVVVTPWKLFGLIGVLLFTGRWFVQMYYSQRAGRPVTPRLFWIMSMVGSVILLAYFIFSPKQDLVGVLSNLFPSVIAGYNLYLDLTHHKRTAQATEPGVMTSSTTDLPSRDRVNG